MKKAIALLFVMLCCLILKNNIVVFANEPNNHFFIYTVDNEYLFEKEDIALNDIYISKDLKRRGMSFVGTTIIYSYLEAIGIINDHELNCEYR